MSSIVANASSLGFSERCGLRRKVEFAMGYLSLALMLSALYAVFCYAPAEEVMGAVQRIFYFHVAAALACYLMVGLLFVGSMAFLRSGRPKWDRFAKAAHTVGFVLATAVLATGMIWGHAVWNVWWRWEPRLVSFLILWLILLAYALLRKFAEGEQGEARFAAVLGVISAINVPIVVLSIKLLKHSEQLHPQVMAERGLTDPRYMVALMWAVGALVLTSIWLFILCNRNLSLRDRLEAVEREYLASRGRYK